MWTNNPVTPDEIRGNKAFMNEAISEGLKHPTVGPVKLDLIGRLIWFAVFLFFSLMIFKAVQKPILSDESSIFQRIYSVSLPGLFISLAFWILLKPIPFISKILKYLVWLCLAVSVGFTALSFVF